VPAQRGAGFHGKLPARGDFLTGNLPRSFVDPWDEWLQAGIAASREQLGERWLAIYLESPIWRFVLSPGACGPWPWAGVLMPSVDKVGRYFPLTIADTLPHNSSPVATVTAAASWFERAEALAVQALENDQLDLEAFNRDIAALAETAPPAGAGPETLPDTCTQAAFWGAELDSTGSVAAGLSILLDRLLIERLETYSIWWNGGTNAAPSRMYFSPKLPPSERFVELLAGPTPAEPPAEPPPTVPSPLLE
jgi:type VI secretion system protein ImpM